MQINTEQFEKIAQHFPKKRGKLSLSDHQVFNAILFVAVNGCKWRALPKEFGNWHTTYTRMNRWAKKGVLDRIFTLLQEKGIIKMNLEVICLDSTSIRVHPHGTGALKKTGLNALASHVGDGQPSFIWLPRMPKQG
jgi:transposase